MSDEKPKTFRRYNPDIGEVEDYALFEFSLGVKNGLVVELPARTSAIDVVENDVLIDRYRPIGYRNGRNILAPINTIRDYPKSEIEKVYPNG